MSILVNAEYCYAIDDISKILEQRLLKEQLRDTFLIDPIFHREKQLIERLEKEKVDHRQSPNRIVLIPYLVLGYDDGNWIGFSVEFADNTVAKVEYFDSASRALGEKLLQKLILDLRKVYGNGIKLEAKISPAGNCEAFSYGPYMIESLVNAAKGDYTNQFTSSPFETRLHHIDLMNRTAPKMNFYAKQRTNKDFEYLEQIKKIAAAALTEYKNVCEHLTEISELVDQIRRDETNSKIIRNVHGYRNPTKKNRKNAKGAKLNFELLSYLKNLNKKDEFESQLRQTKAFKEPIEASFRKLIEKIEYILPKSSDSLGAPDSDFGFLEKILSYHHDLDSLDALLLRLKRIDEPFDDVNDIDRYALGYFFVELGEIAHDITDFIQPENENRTNLLRVLFSKLYALRNVPKNKPKKVRVACQNLFQMRFIMQEVKSDLEELLQHMWDHLKSKLDGIGSVNSNFHEFESDDSKLSLFEEKHKTLIEALIKVLQIKDRNYSEVMSSIDDELSGCDGIVVDKVMKILDKVKDNFATQNPTESSEMHDKSIRKFLEIIDEIRFLQKLLAERTLQCDGFKLGQAAKMSLAFVVDTFKKFDLNQLNNPMLCNDVSTTKKVRNNQIMHKIIYSKLNLDDALAIIKDRIAPWLKDFIALFVCKYRPFFEKNIDQIDSFDYLYTLLKCYNDDRGFFTYGLVSQHSKRNPNKSPKHKLLWLDFIAIVAYNRLGYHRDIIQLYEEQIKNKLDNDVATDEPAVSIAIEYEVAATYMLWDIRNYGEAARLFASALEKSRRIKQRDYEDIHEFRRRMEIRLRNARESINNTWDAAEYFEEVDEGIGILNELMSFRQSADLICKTLKFHFHKFKKDYYELVFLPHIKDILIECKLLILNSLMEFYFNEFDVDSFKSCVKLLYEYSGNIDLKYHVSNSAYNIHSIELTINTSYNIILALCKSTSKEGNQHLAEMHSKLNVMVQCEKTKGIVWTSVLFTKILLLHPMSNECDSSGDRTYTTDYLRKLFEKNCNLKVFAPFRKRVKRDIAELIVQLKNVLRRKLHSAETNDEKTTLKYRLINMKRQLVNIYQTWALKEYLKNNPKCAEFARKILRRAFLFEASVDYLEFKWTHEPAQLSKIGITGKDEENDIIQYIRHRLRSNRTSNLDALMKQCEHYDAVQRYIITTENRNKLRNSCSVDQSDDEYNHFRFFLWT